MTRDPHRQLREAWIIEAVRTPVGRYGGALASVRPDDLAAAVLRAVVDRSGIDAALIEDVILGCANQAGEDNRNVARMALLLAGLPGRGRRADRQPAVRQRAAGDQLGRARDRGRRRRRVHRRRRRVDDPGAVRDGQGRGRLGSRRRASSRTRPWAGGSSTRSSPSGTTRTRWARPPRTSPSAGRWAATCRTRSRSRRSRRRSRRSRPAGSTSQIVPITRAAAEGRAGAGRPRRASARGHLGRGARPAAAGVPRGRHGDRRQRVRDQRRRVGGPAGRGGAGPRARAAADGAGRLDRGRRRRSGGDGRRPGAGHAQGARAGRDRRRRPRPRRAQRGVRLAVDRLHQRARPRSGQGQRQRRRDRARSPARDERRPPDHDAGPRAAPDRRALRARHDVHRRRAGDRHGHRADLARTGGDAEPERVSARVLVETRCLAYDGAAAGATGREPASTSRRFQPDDRPAADGRLPHRRRGRQAPGADEGGDEPRRSACASTSTPVAAPGSATG